MFEEKESFWKKKGFYVSTCVLLVCVMAIGAICYRKTNLSGNDDNMMADIVTETPNSLADNTQNDTAFLEQKGTQENVSEANANLTEKVTNQAASQEQDAKSSTKAKDTNTDETEKKKEKTKNSKSNADKKKAMSSVTTSANSKNYSFNEEKGLLWPVKGEVIMKYSMNNAIYFKTLAQYKCNPGIVISAKTGTKVKAAANCRVTKIAKDDELGTVITTDIGSGYTVLYGQMDNVSVNKGDELKEGDVIGTVARPTKYYTEEGSNLYLQVKEGKETVDPLLLLR